MASILITSPVIIPFCVSYIGATCLPLIPGAMLSGLGYGLWQMTQRLEQNEQRDPQII